MDIFNSLPKSKVQHNTFNLSHDHKLSSRIGKLIPTTCMEMIPGDTFNVSAEAMIRFQPLIAPVMHRLNVSLHHFFVPNRLLWNGWEDFITGNNDDLVPPYMYGLNESGFGPGSWQVKDKDLGAYLGLQSVSGQPFLPEAGDNEEGDGGKVSALPFAAYYKIWEDWYRDENLEPMPTIPVLPLTQNRTSPTQFQRLTTMRNRAWRKDYFTSALPWAQKGEAVQIPVTLSPPQSVGTINDLRRAQRLQEWLEKNARGGTRYIESMYSHFGVISSDARLQRAEFLGGSRSPVVISEVLQTSQTQDTPLGEMGGHAIAIENGKNVSYRAEEHGYFITIMSVLAEPAYQQGIPRMFGKRQNRFDYYWPSFAHIGEQPIENKEVLYIASGDGLGFGNQRTFGYTPRYAEYRHQMNRVSGDFRTNLNYWHFGRIFGVQYGHPALSIEFIDARYTTDRPFAVQGEDYDNLLCHVFHRVKAHRPIPRFGVPTI